MSSFPLPAKSLQDRLRRDIAVAAADGNSDDPFATIGSVAALTELDLFSTSPKKISAAVINGNNKKKNVYAMKSIGSDNEDEVDDYQSDEETTETSSRRGNQSYTVPMKMGPKTGKNRNSRQKGDSVDHRNDDESYETDDYSVTEEEDEDYHSEEEEETTEGEEESTTATEGEDTDEVDDTVSRSSFATSIDSCDTLDSLLIQVQHNDPRLRVLEIDVTSMIKGTAEDLARHLIKNTCVTTIRISCKRLEQKDIGRQRKLTVLSTLIWAIRQNTSIESIEIEDTDISHQLAHALSFQLLAKKQTLKNVALIQCQFIGQSALAILFLGMQHSQSIRNLIFQSCDLGGGGRDQQKEEGGFSGGDPSNVEIIASALPLMKLTSLSLVDVNFPTRECLLYLIENLEKAKELIFLDISQNKLDGQSISLLTKSIRGQHQISRLILSSCSLDNTCMKELATGLRDYDQLTNLDVSKNKHASDRGALQLKDLLKGNAQITKLNVTGCSFSAATLDTLESALRYNNSFLKTFVSEGVGQQIFDVVDAIANLGTTGGGIIGGGGGDADVEEKEMKGRGGGGGGGGKHHGNDRRRRATSGGGKPPSRTRSSKKKSNKSLTDVGGGVTPSKQDEIRTLFRASPPDSSARRNCDNLSRSDAILPPSLPGKSPIPPARLDFSRGAEESPPGQKNVNNVPMPVPQPQFFNEEDSFDVTSSYSRMNGNVPVPKNDSPRELFLSEQDFMETPKDSSLFLASQIGSFAPSNQDTRSAKYVAQRKTAVQHHPKLDRVIQQLSPSTKDTARIPQVRSPRPSAGTTKTAML